MNSLGQEAYEYLKERIQDSNLLTVTENLTESEKEINIDDDNDLINDGNIDTWAKNLFQEISQKTSKTGDDINIYFAPFLAERIKKINTILSVVHCNNARCISMLKI